MHAKKCWERVLETHLNVFISFDYPLCVAVPTVVQRHAQQKRSDLTNYDRFCGKRVNDVTCVIKSLLPQELQQLHRILPEEGKYQLMSLNVEAF